ncbi:FecR domain-containing protein [Sphingomonas sanguinis]|uniref:FecR family protein n=1 Tax=Sphingomonas sanguinis TaxID=33051 RepID=UPI001C55D0E8|nr:FecR domain-containing protein [Sphingomonas sanguinis]QXT36371.1 FecR domain-containing protein [Sphingomonas sanguinis]
MSQDRLSPAHGVDTVALDWALRMADPARADWDAFTDWLEADPGHAERYDRAAATLLDAEEALSVQPEVAAPVAIAPEPELVQRHPLRWIGGAMAAALIGAIGVSAWQDRPQPYAVETAAGETRRIPLSDGSSVTLAGLSRVELDHAEPRRAVLARGEALFQVRHDAQHPFAVQAGTLALIDLGTVFDVRMGGQTRVAVAEGAVMIDPKGAALRLDAGQAVTVDGSQLTRSAVEPEEVGGWREGRLAFDGTPLGMVAEDVSRFLARPVTVAPAIAARPFRGTIDLEAVRRDPAVLGPLMDVRVRQAATGWMLEPRE